MLVLEKWCFGWSLKYASLKTIKGLIVVQVEKSGGSQISDVKILFFFFSGDTNICSSASTEEIGMIK